MVYSKFAFDPVKDKIPVSVTGYVDLRSAMVHSSIPSQIPGTDDDYNGIEDPASILGKPRDVFEAMDMQQHINNYKPDSDKNT